MYEKSHQNINDFHFVIEKNTGSKIIYKHCGCDKCYKGRDINQFFFNDTGIQYDNKQLVSDLIKPCSVFIRKLNLLGHNENTLLNCCLSFPEISNPENPVATKKICRTEHGNSIVENGTEDSFTKNKDAGRKQMDLLFESLCETFKLIKDKKKKPEDIKKVDSDAFSSCNSGIMNTPKEIILNWHQEKKEISKTSKISKPFCMNSSCNYEISCPPMLKSVRKKFDVKEKFENVNENSLHSYEETDSEIENEAPSKKDMKRMQFAYPANKAYYINSRMRAGKIPKSNTDLFVDQRINYRVALSSSTKDFSILPTKSIQDKNMQTHDLLSSLNNSNSYCASDPKTKECEKAKNAFDENRKVEIEIKEELIDHKNLEGKTKNYSVGKNVGFISESSLCLSNHEIKSIEKAYIAVIENSEGEIRIPEECIATRNLKDATKKCSVDISKAPINHNSHGCENEKDGEDDDCTVNLLILNKVVKPCSVFIKPMDEKMISSYCSTAQTVVRDKTNNCIPQMEIVDQCKTDSCPSSSDIFISSATVDKISNRSTIEKCTARNERTSKYLGRIPLIKPCSVLIEKLPFDKCLKLLNPTVVNSVCNEDTFYSNTIKETENYSSEEKNTNQSELNVFSPPDYSISSAAVNKIPNVDAVSKLVINGKARKTPLVKPCCVVNKFSFRKELLAKRSSIKKQYSFLKFKRKVFMTFKRRNRWLLCKKKMFLKSCIWNKIQTKKSDKPFVCKKRKKELKFFKERVEGCEKDHELKEDASINNCVSVHNISSILLQKNQQICYKSLDKTPKCHLSNFQTDKCCVLLQKANAEDINVNSFRYPNKASSMLLRKNQHVCNKSSGTVCTCLSCYFPTINCFVLLERINVDKYLVENNNIFYSQSNLKCNTSSDVLHKHPMPNFRIHNCSVLLERINLEEYLAKNQNIFYQYDLRKQSENLTGLKRGRNKYNRYKTDRNCVSNSRAMLKRKSHLKAEDNSKSDVKKIKRITDHCTVEKTVKNFVTLSNRSNLICDRDYKCVQCRRSIATDIELYHHFCCGKRKKGYICDICEKIFETIPQHKKHMNYHFKFIS